MGITSENVAERYGVSRKQQDAAAMKSHAKAAAARASGRFKDEIIPVHTKLVDPKTGEEKKVTITEDDGIRPGTSLADLAKLKTVFKKSGSTTAGNASQVCDGAGAVLLQMLHLSRMTWTEMDRGGSFGNGQAVWSFDMEIECWTKIIAKDEVPAARSGQSVKEIQSFWSTAGYRVELIALFASIFLTL